MKNNKFFFIETFSNEKVNTIKSCKIPNMAKKYDKFISNNLFKYPPKIARVKPTRIKKDSEKYQLLFLSLKKIFINLGKKIM